MWGARPTSTSMRIILAGIATFALTACVDLSGSSSNVEGQDESGDFDTDDCKIEGSQIGQDGLVLRLGPKSVTFTDWVTKPGEPNEYMGFSMTISGAESVSYIVKAGGERYPSTAATWSHPLGMTANAISNVDVCEECTDGSCDDGGGDGGEDGGDGCIEGCEDDGGGDDGGGDGSGSDDGGGDGSGDGGLY